MLTGNILVLTLFSSRNISRDAEGALFDDNLLPARLSRRCLYDKVSVEQ